MGKLRIAVVGYGNIGKYTVQALQAAPDMRLPASFAATEVLTSLLSWQSIK